MGSSLVVVVFDEFPTDKSFVCQFALSQTRGGNLELAMPGTVCANCCSKQIENGYRPLEVDGFTNTIDKSTSKVTPSNGALCGERIVHRVEIYWRHSINEHHWINISMCPILSSGCRPTHKGFPPLSPGKIDYWKCTLTCRTTLEVGGGGRVQEAGKMDDCAGWAIVSNHKGAQPIVRWVANTVRRKGMRRRDVAEILQLSPLSQP